MISKTVLLFGLCLYSYIQDILAGTKCFKNEIYGEREGNVYSCEDSGNTECCEKNQEFVCCEPASQTALREQLQLWGCVSGFVILLIIIGICLRKDFNLCKSERWIFYKYTKEGKAKKKSTLVDNEVTETDQRDYQPNYKEYNNFVYDGNAVKN
ncbi:hypothetical protein SNE40_003137 [Patella caerulea]|uniref:Uncharacterized protein n=1 Tax=Patella caerulea TaxID=87958 RepID=A0AAN8Q4R7_PATCE